MYTFINFKVNSEDDTNLNYLGNIAQQDICLLGKGCDRGRVGRKGKGGGVYNSLS